MNRNEPSDWMTSRRFAALLAIFICLSWPGVLLGLKSFVYRDFGFYCVPVAGYLKQCLWHFQLPLWNPLNYCGEPFLAQWNSQALYPPALFYLLLPLPWSLNVFCLLHLFIGGLGMFTLARAWSQNSFGAAIAGSAFAAGGLMLSSLLWPATISALAWMPWVVWLAKRGWREGGRILVTATIIGALQMLSGGVEVALLTWVLLGALWIAELVTSTTSRTKIILRFCALVIFISGLCAIQLLPFYELLGQSQREHNYFAADSPTPLTGWANFLVPLFRCDSVDGIYFQKGQYWVLSYYAGIATVGLAALAIWRRPRATIIVSGILSIFCILLATGNATPVYPWLSSHIGVIDLIRFPSKFLILPAFTLPLMAAYALSEKSPETIPNPSRSGKTWLFLWLTSIAIIISCLVWLRTSHTDNSTVYSNELARIIFFSAIIFCLFLLEKITQGSIRHWLQILTLLLVWLDLNLAMPKPAAVSPSVFQPNMSRPLPAPQFGSSRALIPASVLRQLTFATQPDAAQNFLSHRFAMFGNCNLLDGIPKCDGFFALDLAKHDLFNNDLGDPMLDFLGASEILTVRSNVLEWTPRSTFMPLLTGGQQPLFADDPDTLQLIIATNFNPRTQVYLPLGAKSIITVTNMFAVKISSQKFSAQEIDATVDAPAAAMVVAAQSYSDDWRAFVDGQPAPLWPADYAFQAVQIPAGKHQLKLIYVDRPFQIGAVISLVTFALLAIYYFRCPARFVNSR